MIDAIITDFDGTLVDTFKANFWAYEKAFSSVGLSLDEETYRHHFGLRADSFMKIIGIEDSCVWDAICRNKAKFYPTFFSQLKLNNTLVEIISSFHSRGCMTAIASTARKENLMNVLKYFNLNGMFDLVYAGSDVKKGKPSPEIYLKAMAELKVSPQKTLIFEDSEVGIRAALSSGAKYIRVTDEWFNI